MNRPKHARDLNQRAKRMVDLATGAAITSLMPALSRSRKSPSPKLAVPM